MHVFHRYTSKVTTCLMFAARSWRQIDRKLIWNSTMPLVGASFFEDVLLVEFMYLVFTRMPGKSYRRRFMSLLLYLCYVFWALINSLVCRFDRKRAHYLFRPKENFTDFLPFVRICWHFFLLNAGNHFRMNLSGNYGIFTLKIIWDLHNSR